MSFNCFKIASSMVADLISLVPLPNLASSLSLARFLIHTKSKFRLRSLRSRFVALLPETPTLLHRDSDEPHPPLSEANYVDWKVGEPLEEVEEITRSIHNTLLHVVT